MLDGLVLGRLLGRLPIGVVSIGPTLAIDYLNPAALAYLGSGAAGELLPDPWPIFSLRKFAGRLFSGSTPPRRVVETDSGRLLELDGIPAESGPTALLLMQDVTARERRSRAEREFVTNAAHELRTPIAAIAGAIEVLQGGAKEQPADRDLFLGHIERESSRLGRLAAALLLLARIQTGHRVTTLGVVEVRPLLEDVVRQLEPHDGVEVQISCEPGLSVLADRDLLSQAVLNVAANAARHTKEGEIELACRDLGRACEIEVRDTGPGITDLDRERVFDRFFRGRGPKGSGSGLGLAITREIMRALSGTIELDSTVGVRHAGAAATACSAAGEDMTARILVLEDEPALADTVSYALRGEGYDVETVDDGDHAMTVARERPFDVLVLDVMLPGLSGLEVCRQLRGESAVPILMLTARDSEVDRVLGLEAGADDYLTKPFSMSELLARIRAILRRRRLDAEEGHPAREIGGLRLDLERYEATVDGDPVHLTQSELKLVAFLAREPGCVYSRRQIMQHLWDSDYIGDERAADLHVSNIRRKIERDAERPERLVTVRGAGYKLNGV